MQTMWSLTYFNRSINSVFLKNFEYNKKIGGLTQSAQFLKLLFGDGFLIKCMMHKTHKILGNSGLKKQQTTNKKQIRSILCNFTMWQILFWAFHYNRMFSRMLWFVLVFKCLVEELKLRNCDVDKWNKNSDRARVSLFCCCSTRCSVFNQSFSFDWLLWLIDDSKFNNVSNECTRGGQKYYFSEDRKRLWWVQ